MVEDVEHSTINTQAKAVLGHSRISQNQSYGNCWSLYPDIETGLHGIS